MIDPITEYILTERRWYIPPKPKSIPFEKIDFLKSLNDLERSLGIPLTKNITDTWYMRKGYKAIGAAIVVALVVGLSYKAYRKFLSKAARTCKQYKGNEKNECIKKFRDDANKARAKVLQKSKTLCSKSKDPKSCISKIDNKIRKLKQ